MAISSRLDAAHLIERAGKKSVHYIYNELKQGNRHENGTPGAGPRA